MITPEALLAYWREPILNTNILVFLNLLGALILGLCVGYERAYHGRAAGVRTYGLVCMASCALTVVSGYPHDWFGGNHTLINAMIDPTRVIQGVVTGIGFLGAGIIMKDGMNISGLTTAASIWASSAIGILVGLGFYPAAILLTALSAGFMMYGSMIENILPSRQGINFVILFRPGFLLTEEKLNEIINSRGYIVARGSLSTIYRHQQQEWQFIGISSGEKAMSLIELSNDLPAVEGIESLRLGRARN